MQQTDIEGFTQKLLPLTVLRRNAGMVFKRLSEIGEFIVTKDGKPIARLSSLKISKDVESISEKLKKLHKLAGGLKIKKHPNPKDITRILNNRHEKMLS